MIRAQILDLVDCLGAFVAAVVVRENAEEPNRSFAQHCLENRRQALAVALEALLPPELPGARRLGAAIRAFRGGVG